MLYFYLAAAALLFVGGAAIEAIFHARALVLEKRLANRIATLEEFAKSVEQHLAGFTLHMRGLRAHQDFLLHNIEHLQSGKGVAQIAAPKLPRG